MSIMSYNLPDNNTRLSFALVSTRYVFSRIIRTGYISQLLSSTIFSYRIFVAHWALELPRRRLLYPWFSAGAPPSAVSPIAATLSANGVISQAGVPAVASLLALIANLSWLALKLIVSRCLAVFTCNPSLLVFTWTIFRASTTECDSRASTISISVSYMLKLSRNIIFFILFVIREFTKENKIIVFIIWITHTNRIKLFTLFMSVINWKFLTLRVLEKT